MIINIGKDVRKHVALSEAEKQTLEILKQRHYKEYEAILKKRFEIVMKQWDDVNSKKVVTE